MEGRKDIRHGDEDVADALSGTRRVEGRVGTTARSLPADDPRLSRVRPVGPRVGGGRRWRTNWTPSRESSRRARGLSPADGAAAVGGGAGGRLRGQLRQRPGLCALGAVAGGSGKGGAFRDATGELGPKRLAQLQSKIAPMIAKHSSSTELKHRFVSESSNPSPR